MTTEAPMTTTPQNLASNVFNSTAATASYWSTTADAVGTVETSLNEPSTTGLASQLNTFWNDWQVVANTIGTGAASGAANQLIQQGGLVASTISGGYAAAKDAWSAARTAAASTATTINTVAADIADARRLAAAHGFDVVRAGETPFTIWDGVGFHLRRAS